MSENERKNSMKVVAIDMSDPATHEKHVRIAGLVLAVLISECDSPIEAYAIAHHVIGLLGRSYDIAGAEDIHMQTDKVQ